MTISKRLLAIGLLAMLVLAVAAILPALAAPPAQTADERIAELERIVARTASTEVTAINVNVTNLGGDAILTIGPDGTTVLFDGGEAPHWEDYVKPYLLSRRITHLDYIAISEPSRNHLNGLTELLHDVSVTVDTFLVPEVRWASWTVEDPAWVGIVKPYWDAAISAALSNGVTIATVYQDSVVALGNGAEWRVLHGWENAQNGHNAMVARVSYQGLAVMLPSDATGTLWPWLAANADITNDVLLMPHHCDNLTGVVPYVDQMGSSVFIGSTTPVVSAEAKCISMYQSAKMRGIDFYLSADNGHISAFLRWDGVTIETER